jgi:hypothetical protein
MPTPHTAQQKGDLVDVLVTGHREAERVSGTTSAAG